MIQDIANKHKLILSRVAGEKSDMTPERAIALLNRFVDNANVLELLAHFGFVSDFTVIETNPDRVANDVAEAFNLSVESHGPMKCVALTENAAGGSFVLCWTKLHVRSKEKFIKEVVSRLSSQQDRLEMLIDALDNLDD
jgi:hypothetical protein